jgi:cobalt-zinc-cadmium efflux system membrane fusion protein
VLPTAARYAALRAAAVFSDLKSSILTEFLGVAPCCWFNGCAIFHLNPGVQIFAFSFARNTCLQHSNITMSHPENRQSNGSKLLAWLQKFGALLTVAAIALFGFWGGHFLLPGESSHEHESESVEVQTSAESNQVSLSSEKLNAAKLKTEIVKPGEFQSHKSIPGTVTHDSTRKIKLRATITSVVKQTLVAPNQFVVKGQPLFVLTAPDVGSARSDISMCEASIGLLEREYNWTSETHSNIKELLDFLDNSPSFDEIKARFENRLLGEHRNEILTAYSELTLAKKLASRAVELQSQGAISGKESQQRKSAVDIAAAKFNSIREETNFQISQQSNEIEAKLAAENKRLAIYQAQLDALLGPNAEPAQNLTGRNDLVTDPETLNPTLTADLSVSDFVYNAPRSGRLVEMAAVESARFEAGEVMAEIADTSVVWIEAQVSQRDWHVVKLEPNQPIPVRLPGLPTNDSPPSCDTSALQFLRTRWQFRWSPS